MRMLTLAILLSQACVQMPEPDLKLRQGISVFVYTDREVSVAAMEEQVQIVEDLFVLRGVYSRKDIRKAWSYLQVELHHTRIPCDQSEEGCWGLQFEGYILTYWKPCVGMTAFAHELIHFLQLALDNHQDFKHENGRFFRKANSIEWEAKAQAREWQQCGL